MIRVNLLAGENRLQRPTPSVASGRVIPLVGSLLLIIAALAGGWRSWTMSQLHARLASEIEAARREEARLAAGQTEVTAAEVHRAQLQQRLALIGNMRRSQSVSVHIIDQISRSLPERTWLTSLRQDGEQVTLEGQCTSMTALADFVANLESSRQFKRPVEIVASEVVEHEAADLIRFTIKGAFNNSPAPTETTPSAPGGTVG